VKFENATITGHFGFVFEENWTGKSYDYREVIFFEKLPFQNVPYTILLRCHRFPKSFVFKMFSVHTETQADVFKLLWFEERFRKAPFL